MQAYGVGRGRAADDTGRLAGSEAVPGDEREDLPIVVGQRRERRRHLGALGDVVRDVTGPQLAGPDPQFGVDGLAPDLRALLLAQDVAGHAEQPGEFALRDLTEPPPGDEEGLAGHLVGDLSPGPADHLGVHPGMKRVVQRGEPWLPAGIGHETSFDGLMTKVPCLSIPALRSVMVASFACGA